MKGRNTVLSVKKAVVNAATARLSVIAAALLVLAWWLSRDMLLEKQLKSGPEHTAGSAGFPNDGMSDPVGVRLYVGVLSSAANLARRMAIRQTWGADASLERVVFVVANPAHNITLLESLRQEAQNFQDLIIVGHVVESYYNITYKTLDIFRSAYAYSRHVTHVMKCDDDSYLHIGRLLRFLAQHPFDSRFIGRMKTTYRPQRKKTSRFYVSNDEWPEDKSNVTWAYGGAGYILTKDLADEVATTAAYLCSSGRLFKLEDVALASWLQCIQHKLGLHVNVVHDLRFNSTGCAEGNIVSHKRTAEQMTCMFASDGKCC